MANERWLVEKKKQNGLIGRKKINNYWGVVKRKKIGGTLSGKRGTAMGAERKRDRGKEK